jgi:hypothetical protein
MPSSAGIGLLEGAMRETLLTAVCRSFFFASDFQKITSFRKKDRIIYSVKEIVGKKTVENPKRRRKQGHSACR